MRRSRQKPNEFIIQNFRSWQGKNCIELNSINFLFGGNSSGKSSIISALALLKQSQSDRPMVGNFSKLILTGDEISLGKIENQYFGGTDAVKILKGKRQIKLSDQIGFGLRMSNPDKVSRMCQHRRSRIDSKSKNYETSPAKQNQIFNKLEIMFYYSPSTGLPAGFSLRGNGYDLLQAKLIASAKNPRLSIEFCKEEAFWKDVLKLLPNNFGLNGFRRKDWDAIVGHPGKLRSENDKVQEKRNAAIEIISRWQRIFTQKIKLAEETMPLQTKYSTEYEKSSKSDDVLAAQLEDKKREMDVLIGQETDIVKTAKELGIKINTIFGENNFEEQLKNLEEQSFTELVTSKIDCRLWNKFEIFMRDLSEYQKFEIKLNSEEDLHTNILSIERLLADFDNEISYGGIGDFEQKVPENLFLFWRMVSHFIFAKSNFAMIALNLIREFRSLIMRVDQIGPHRERPDRVAVINPSLNFRSVGKSGQNLLNLLHACNEPEIDNLNLWIKDKLEIPYRLDTKFHPEFNVQEILIIDEEGLKSSILDVGYGISQVLPIVVQSVLSKNRFITIEQPELHVHPRLQANLTDLFIWSAKTNNNKFIIETHSEHLVLRLMRRQRERILLDDKTKNARSLAGEWKDIFTSVNINVIEKLGNPKKSDITQLKINSKGEFTEAWPGGFFAERFIEKGLRS